MHLTIGESKSFSFKQVSEENSSAAEQMNPGIGGPNNTENNQKRKWIGKVSQIKKKRNKLESTNLNMMLLLNDLAKTINKMMSEEMLKYAEVQMR